MNDSSKLPWTPAPATRKGVLKRLRNAPKPVQEYFAPAEELIEPYPLEVSLSYLFSRLERAHIMALYCGAVKCHKVDIKLAKSALERFENRPDEFRKMFKNVFGKKVPQSLIETFDCAQNVRNNVLHGKSVKPEDFRKAIAAIIYYATEFDETCSELGKFRPFGKLQGFKGAAAPMDKSASRLVLKGLGFPIS